MREIEIKVRVQDSTALREVLLQKQIELSEPITQRDRVFGLEEGGEDSSLPWLRIRTETKGGKVVQIFTLKRSVTNQMDSIEHETEVADETELEKIILQLGFSSYSDLTKIRQKARIGEIELCFDIVEGLGEFVEAEKLTADDADYDEVAGELWRLLESLGVNRRDHVTDGYDVLMKKLEAQV